MSNLHTLAFEIGTEEIPAFDLHRATQQLEKLVPEALDRVRIPHGDVAVYTTPRRLIMIVSDVADETAALEEAFRGPSAKIAFDADGNPTKAAAGFARGKGVGVGRARAAATRAARSTCTPTRSIARARRGRALCRGVLAGVVRAACSWPKTQPLGQPRASTSARPVRWLVALLGRARWSPCEFAGLEAGRLTRGHRFLAPGPHEVPTAAALHGRRCAAASRGARARPAREAVHPRAAWPRAEAAHGAARAELPAKTLQEVVNLGRAPHRASWAPSTSSSWRVPEEIIGRRHARAPALLPAVRRRTARSPTTSSIT